MNHELINKHIELLKFEAQGNIEYVKEIFNKCLINENRIRCMAALTMIIQHYQNAYNKMYKGVKQ